MDGITILAEKNVYNYLLPEWILLVLLILFAVFVMLAVILATKEKSLKIVTALAILAGILMIIALVCVLIPNKNSIKYKEYKVLIDDDVSFQEVYNKYEIIDKDGEIYTIREKQ